MKMKIDVRVGTTYMPDNAKLRVRNQFDYLPILSEFRNMQNAVQASISGDTAELRGQPFPAPNLDTTSMFAPLPNRRSKYSCKFILL